ncbi:MAG: hypothetical protein AAFV98_06845 [Chloroflexota bacterium]
MKRWFLFFCTLCLLLTGVLLASAQDDPTPTAPSPILPTATPTQEIVTINPLLGLRTRPPFEIDLPEDWQLALRDTFTYRDVIEDGDGALETVPIDVYTGPLSNGAQGWIVMLWGYDSLAPFDPLQPEGDPIRTAWLDGLRLLQFVVFDVRCNFGTAPQREYSVGGLPAVGTTFSAVDCPDELPDTRGWFALLDVDGLDFAFYAYADPIQPAGSPVEFELQAILDTIEFDVQSITITAQEFQATQQSLLLTPRATLIDVNPQTATAEAQTAPEATATATP